ncbi:polyprenyl synthetase family protein [Streptomyces sp. NPDC087300]|uniref:polyprenyl synthetase family protein n=1 Tax=Streptomyces sp. NPDC087300 TaxID=3365780 RepID=UPI0037F778D6
MPSPSNTKQVRDRVGSVLTAFVTAKTEAARRQGLPVAVPLAVGEFLAAGGKRIRPLMCVLGWHAAGGSRSASPAVQAGAALEMFHAFCLIHDDVMDHSDTRRGRPTVHRALARHHSAGRTAQAARNLGAGAAILAGDLALLWSDELLNSGDAGLDAIQCERVRPLVNVMRSEVMYGQHLDLVSTGQPTTDVDSALLIARYKTAKYTIERPLQIGAALAGAEQRLLARLSEFALPLGEAFQLRDDLLGAFGNQGRTGKPALDDLRQGKHTALAAHALRTADADQVHRLRTRYGDPALDEAGAAALRTVFEDTGALRAVEHMIVTRYERALAALDAARLPQEADTQLRSLARRSAWRTA